ncbi:respiratory nitrate reductase subunit gamma [Kibdelosporangium aridum]|uniref:Nitrate reductase-like protein NarX n=1 Tax=Kibdelosporangium aridum TaxID=2030 RepID=A0A428ZAR7_KIBAR|nr:respiratory nitrate reductase subunit gamma [Kibdelosporangium aridum]RSM85146.1 respiratory nitrate reductase subunit gamma [Kibdelosporangium aridum]
MTADIALWVVLPYIALTIFVVGHVWRWRADQFGWTTRTTQILENRWLRLGSPLFHLGALAAIGGHIMGLLIPKAWFEAVRISDHLYHIIAVGAGTVAGLMVMVGMGLLIARRVVNGRVRRTTTRMDKVMYLVFAVVVILGMAETVGVNLFGAGYDYRDTVAVWFRGIFYLQPDSTLMAGAPLVYQLHASSAWVFIALWPFTRLVHVWSAPIAYLWRPYVVYRRRVDTGQPGTVTRTFRRAGRAVGPVPTHPAWQTLRLRRK